MMKKNLFIIFILILPLLVYSQNYKERNVMGEQNARLVLKKALRDKTDKPFYDTLIKDRETAIRVVEPILFKIFGKKNIVRERPYECYLIDGYWYVCGTLPKNFKGGVFEIIIDSRDGKVIRLTHGK